MSAAIQVVSGAVVNGSIVRADSDSQLVDLFLSTFDSERTVQTYAIALDQFRAWAGVGLRELKLEDIADYKQHLQTEYSSAHSRKLKLNAVKSLLTFAYEAGYTPFNVGRAVKADKTNVGLAQRILTEEQAIQLLNAPQTQRNRVLLRLLYASGGRVSEVAALTWADVQPNGETGQVRLVGKGGGERYILLSQATWSALMQYKPAHTMDDEPVFPNSEGLPISRVQIFRIVKAAGKRAGLDNVSPHWLRHAHASHSLDRGASLAVVKETLGHANIATTNKYLHAKPNDSSALHLPV